MDKPAKFKIGDLVQRKVSAGRFGHHVPGTVCRVGLIVSSSFQTDPYDGKTYSQDSYELISTRKSGFGQWIRKHEVS